MGWILQTHSWMKSACYNKAAVQQVWTKEGEEGERERKWWAFAMDIITQLQDQLDEMAVLAINTFGTLQRDAPPDRLSSSYPDPLNPNPKPEDDSKPQVQAQPGAPPPPPAQAQPPAPDLTEQPKAMSRALVLAAKKVGTLPHFSSRCPHLLDQMLAR